MAHPISLERTDIHVGVALAAVTCANPLVGVALGIGAITAYALSVLKKDIAETLRPRLSDYLHPDLMPNWDNTFQGEFVGFTGNELAEAKRNYQKIKMYHQMRDTCPIL